MKFTARVDGLGALGEALSRIADPAAIRSKLRASAESVRDAARARLEDSRPPDSRQGALARSLTAEPFADGMSWTVSTPLAYGWHVEFGSLGRPATPWLAPALDETRPGIVSRIAMSVKGLSV
jgi:hypothetical protein